MNEYLSQISSYIDGKRDEMINLWKDVVNLESYAREKDNVNIVANRFKKEFEAAGMECKLIDVGANGNTLVGILGADRKEKPVIFSGHMDTVFPMGTFGGNPFRIDNDRAYGPGVLDMKGGIIIALYVIKALNDINFNERPIKIIFSGDEEIGHVNSKGGEIIKKESKGGICAFNMETGLMDNSLCIGRKGRIECHVTIKGVDAHAGNDFSKGRNAIEEMSYKVIQLQKLTNLDVGTTVSVGKITGGTVSNSVPAQCKIEIDIRFENMDEMDKVKQNIEDVCTKTYINDTTTKIDFINVMPPYETTDDVVKFYNFANKISTECDFGPLGSKKLGGSSDASYITLAGTPVLCSFGVMGQGNHTTTEFALVETLFERSKLISAIVMNLKQFEE